MKAGWTRDRSGTHKASISPAIDLTVRGGRELPGGTEYSIRIAQLTLVQCLSDDEAAKRFAEDKCRALLEEALGHLATRISAVAPHTSPDWLDALKPRTERPHDRLCR